MSELLEVLSPAAAATPAVALPENRVTGWQGRRVAVLENGKPNFHRLVGLVLDRLAREQQLAGVAHFQKFNPAVGARPALLDEVARSADLVITGSAD